MTTSEPARRLEVRRSSLAFHGGGERRHQDALRGPLESCGIVTSRTVLLGDNHRDETDFLHLWNLQDPREATAAANWARTAQIPYCVTPLEVDRTKLFEGSGLARTLLSPNEKPTEELLREYESGALLEEVREQIVDDEPEPIAWAEMRQRTIANAALVHCLSEAEADRVAALYGVERSSIVVSGVAPSIAETAEHANRESLGEYVLVPASRLEILKNQLGAVLAARHVQLPFVFTGSAHDTKYAELCMKLAPENTRFVGLRGPNEYENLLRGARIVLHPSFLECASLALIDAAAVGSSIVTSDIASEREYYGDNPRYVDPCSPIEIANAVVEAWNAVPSEPERGRLMRAVARKRTWDECGAVLGEALQRLAPAMA